MLSQLKQIFIEKKSANLLELTQLLSAEPDAVRGMLQHWIRKGKIKQAETNSSCGSKCTKCSPLAMEQYEWL